MNNQTNPFIKSIVEAILYISEKPVTLEQFKEVLAEANSNEIKEAIAELTKEYEDNRRGMIVTEIAGGYQMLSSPHFVTYVRNFFKKRVKEKLSRPALETLAIIAYKQPVTRGEIEMIRGVNSDGVTELLLTKELIKIVGRKDIPGRPYLYGTTKVFLEYFGLKSLEDLPKLEEIPSMFTPEVEVELAGGRAEIDMKVEEAAARDAGDTVVAADAIETEPQEQSPSVRAEADTAAVAETVAQTPLSQATDEPDQKAATEKTGQPVNAVEDVAELKQAMDEINKGERENTTGE